MMSNPHDQPATSPFTYPAAGNSAQDAGTPPTQEAAKAQRKPRPRRLLLYTVLCGMVSVMLGVSSWVMEKNLYLPPAPMGHYASGGTYRQPNYSSSIPNPSYPLPWRMTEVPPQELAKHAALVKIYIRDRRNAELCAWASAATGLVTCVGLVCYAWPRRMKWGNEK